MGSSSIDTYQLSSLEVSRQAPSGDPLTPAANKVQRRSC